MANFEADTKTLKTLINNTKKSGKQAWEAGKILKNIDKNNLYTQKKYKRFSQYTNKEFRITEGTARQYISVCNNISKDKITDNMLVSHLYTIAEMDENHRVGVLDALAVAENENGGKIPYDGDIVMIIANLLKGIEPSLEEEDYKEIYNFIKQQDDKENEFRKRRKRIVKNPSEVADELDNLSINEKYKSILNLYKFVPISEQGLVGLFCTIFHLLKKEGFLYKDETAYFEQIVYIRTEFPDARIRINKNPTADCDEQNNCQSLDIEFELNSFNYWRHKHHKDEKECDMIICWEIDNPPKKLEVELPPILCLKDILESGKIKLFDSIQD